MVASRERGRHREDDSRPHSTDQNSQRAQRYETIAASSLRKLRRRRNAKLFKDAYAAEQLVGEPQSALLRAHPDYSYIEGSTTG